VGIDVGDAEATTLEEPVETVEGAVVEPGLKPVEGDVELLRARR
jgi:hypothetical protein